MFYTLKLAKFQCSLIYKEIFNTSNFKEISTFTTHYLRVLLKETLLFECDIIHCASNFIIIFNQWIKNDGIYTYNRTIYNL